MDIREVLREVSAEIRDMLAGLSWPGPSKIESWASRIESALASLPAEAQGDGAVAEVAREMWCGERTVRWLRSDSDDGNDLLTGTKLYTAPPPQPAPETAAQASVEFGEALDAVLAAYERNCADWRADAEQVNADRKQARSELLRLHAAAVTESKS